ncbi:MAG: DUF4013 domain-containing protein [Thermofilum sp.]
MIASRFDVGEAASRSFEFMSKLLKDAGNLILLIVLNIIPIVNFIVLGYFARVVRLDLDEPPKLTSYADLFVEGLKLFLAFLLYAFIPLILIAVGYAVSWPLAVIHPWFWLYSPFAVLGFLLLLAFLFVGLSALAIYMRTGDFSKVFAFQEAWSLIQHVGIENYLIFFILLAVFNLAAGFVGSIIPLVGTAIVGVFAMAFTFKALSLFVNTKYPIPPPPP